MNSQKHLTLDSRITIENKLNERESFKAIGRFLGKDCTTISKEITSVLRKAVPMADPLMTAAWLSNANVLLKIFVNPALPVKIASAGPVANALLPAFSMRNMFALIFPGLLMSVTDALIVINVFWKNAFTKLPMHKKNTNRSEASPVPVLLSPNPNSNR